MEGHGAHCARLSTRWKVSRVMLTMILLMREIGNMRIQGSTRRSLRVGRRELIQEGYLLLLLLLLEQHSLMMNIGRLEQALVRHNALMQTARSGGGCNQLLLMVIGEIGAARGGCRGGGWQWLVSKRRHVLKWIVGILSGLVWFHNLSREFAKSALAWIYLSLIIFNTNSND